MNKTTSILWFALSVTLIVLGIVCMVNPSNTMIWLTYFVGFIMLFSGVGGIAYYFQTRFTMMLVDGILSTLFGLILLFCNNQIAENFIPYLIALWLILKGILWLIHSFKIKNFIQGSSILGITIIGGIYIILGIIFLVFPQILATLISFALGTTLMITGGVGIYFWNNFRNNFRNLDA